MKDNNVIQNPWAFLQQYTDARIGLGRAGTSIPTHQWLEFQLAHAQAQDAVHAPLNIKHMVNEFATELPNSERAILLHSQAEDRATYLQRPDLGRRLHSDSVQKLTQFKTDQQQSYDLAIVIADGLSSLAIEKNASEFLSKLYKRLDLDKGCWSVAPICIVEQGRVAIGDEVGELLNANAVLMLIGERPGLSSPDSLGLYLTWKPKLGLTDASRNCISNVRQAGLCYDTAVEKSYFLLAESRRLKLSGVNLKEDAQPILESKAEAQTNFLLDE